MGLNEVVLVGGVSFHKPGREFDFFITAVKTIGVPLHRLLPSPFQIKYE